MTDLWRPPYSYRLERDDRQRVFNLRKTLLPGRKSICQVFEAGVDNDSEDRDGLRGLPWPTLVLGSGCLAIASDPWPGPDDIIRAVQRWLVDVEPPFASQHPNELVDDFIRTLFEDRVRSRSAESDSAAQEPVDIAEETARLTLLTARLTRFYHLIHASQINATPRWGSDRATYDPKKGLVGLYTQNIQDSLVIPTVADLEFLLESFDPDRGSDDPIEALAYHTLHDVQRKFPSSAGATKELHLDHIRQLSEIAWHLLTRNTGIYPGWSDLLLSLLLKQGRQPHATTRPKRRPLYRSLYELQGAILEWFEEPTRRSFASALVSREAAPRPRFFDAAAALLQAEAKTLVRYEEARGEGHPIDHAVEFPPASAFVTSFDLELEMALWRGGKPFSVVVPVHVQQRERGKAALVWLICDVEPAPVGAADDQLRALRRGSRWSVFTTRKRLEPSRKTRPIVVRLSGSPLMQLPDEGWRSLLGSQLDDVGVPVSDESRIYHALTVDEYTALQRSTAELVAFQRVSQDADRPSTALPEDLSLGSTHIPRFWVALGAQLSDPAIRHQLFTEIFKVVSLGRESPELATPARTAPVAVGPEPDVEEGPYFEDDEETPRAADHVEPSAGRADGDNVDLPSRRDFVLGGLAVNHRVEDDDVGLLYWLEFTVVRDDCAEFIGDLDHYRKHVLAPSRRPSPERCPLAEGRQ